jgi:hypothetical protein
MTRRNGTSKPGTSSEPNVPGNVPPQVPDLAQAKAAYREAQKQLWLARVVEHDRQLSLKWARAAEADRGWEPPQEVT